MELDHEESWALKNWYFWTVVLEETLESPLDSKEIQPVHPKGYQSWIFIGRTNAEAETPILWPPDMKNWLTGKDPYAEKNRRQKEKGMTEDEMIGWHHRLDGHEFEQALGVGVGQGTLECWSTRACRQLHKTSNWTELISILQWENQQLERLNHSPSSPREEEVEWSFSSRVLPQIPSPFHYTEFSEIYILIRLVVLFPLLFRNFLYQSQHKNISLVCNKWSSNPTFFNAYLFSFEIAD